MFLIIQQSFGRDREESVLKSKNVSLILKVIALMEVYWIEPRFVH